MSTNYTTYQQHEPLRAPNTWSASEKRFVAQLEEVFDDIYRRFGRLRLEDMSKTFRQSYKKVGDDLSELSTDVEVTAEGLSAEITRATQAEGNLSTSIQATADGVTATFKKIGASGYTATGITTITENGITVTHSSLSNTKTEMSAGGFRILNSSGTVLGGVMSLNGQVVTAMSSLYNASYPAFVMDVGTYVPYDTEGTSSGQGLSLKSSGTEFMHIGRNVYASGYAQYNEISSAQGLYIVSTGGMFFYQRSGSSISLTNSDITFSIRSGNTRHTVTVSELYNLLH